MSTPVPPASLKASLAAHPIYGAVRSLRDLRTFMEHHVVCVLDFMSIVKGLQRDLTSMGPVWLPPGRPAIARFINEIVLDEESDEAYPGEGPRSHFEWYLEAMDQVGADTAPIRALCADLAAGTDPLEALERSALPAAARAFGAVTFSSLEAPLHLRASIFFHGREDVIPRMFLPLVRELRESGVQCSLLLAYLERHIEADGEHHGPLAQQLLDELCGARPAAIDQATAAATRALEARAALWDATLRALDGAAAPRPATAAATA